MKQVIINLQRALQIGLIPEDLDDNEASKITVLDVLEYINFEDIPVIIQQYIKKLSHGGELLLVFNNIDNVISTIQNTTLSLQEINNILFGDVKIAGKVTRKSCALNVLSIKEILQQNQLINITINFDGIKAKISGVRK